MNKNKSKKVTVLWFNQLKGFGEVESDSGQRLFLHWGALPDNGKFKSVKPGEVLNVITKDNKTIFEVKHG